MYKIFIYLLLFVSFKLAAQIQADTAVINENLKRGIEVRRMKVSDDSIRSANLDSSAIYFQQAIDKLEQLPNPNTKLIDFYYQLGITNWTKRDLSKNKNQAIIRNQLFEQAMQLFNKAISFDRSNFSPSDYVKIAKVHNYTGHIIGSFGNYEKAIEEFGKTNEIYKVNELKEDEFLAYACKRIGTAYLRLGDRQSAEVYLEKALKIYLEYNNEDNVGKCYQELGTLHLDEKNLAKSQEYYLKALAMKGLRPKLKMMASLNLSSIYLQTKEYDKALALTDEIIAAYAENKQPEDAVICKAHEVKGIVYKEKNRFKEAFENLDKAYRIAKRENVYGIHNRETAKILYNIGDAYKGINDYENALEKYQNSLYSLIPEFDTRNVNKLPSYDDLYHEVWILENLQAKGEVFKELYEATDSLAFLEIAYEHFKMCTNQLELLRSSFDNEDSKIDIIESVYSIYDQAISMAHIFYSKTKDKKYLANAFEFMEKSKAAVLLESIRSFEEKENSGLPSRLINKEKDLIEQINEWKLKSENSSNESVVTLATDTLYKLVSQQDALKKEIIQDYPDYKDIKYSSDVNTDWDVKSNLLNVKSALLEYFLLDNMLYTYVISKDKSYFLQMPLDTLFDKQIENLRTCLNRPDDSVAGFATFVNSSNRLYEVVLKPALDSLGTEINQLIIVPDYKLNYIPFEIFLTHLPESTEDVNYKASNLDYLIEEYDITYGYSSSLLIEGQKGLDFEPDLIENNYLGFGPSFGVENEAFCNDAELSELDNQAAIEPIRTLLAGVSYLNQESTKENFFGKSNESLILHLHTHACMDDEEPMNSKIYFSDEPAYTYELYNLDLKADLAILSACNTGTGQLRRGEGLMSLSRAFMHSGCPSIVTSLWKASEEITKEIILNFNKNLKRGQKKNRALRTAKLKFLKDPSTSKAESHPFYWATFIHVGDTAEIVYRYQNFWNLIKVIALVVCLLLILFLPYRLFYSKTSA